MFLTLRKSLAAFSVPALALSLTGCLDTRPTQKEQDEKLVLRKQISNVQQNTADMNTRFQDIEDDQRKIHGRVDSFDNQLQKTNKLIDKVAGAADSRIKEKDDVYREEFAKLNAAVNELRTQLAGMQSAQEESRKAQAEASARAAAEAAKSSDESAKNPFSAAEAKFDKKQWTEAAVDYQRYRKANPKGKQFALATYKMGVCFQELGDLEGAKAMYDEVMSRFAGTKEADKAKTRLAGLNKKDKKKK